MVKDPGGAVISSHSQRVILIRVGQRLTLEVCCIRLKAKQK